MSDYNPIQGKGIRSIPSPETQRNAIRRRAEFKLIVSGIDFINKTRYSHSYAIYTSTTDGMSITFRGLRLINTITEELK